MAPKKKVPSLQDLTLQAVQKLVTAGSNNAINNDQVSLRSLTSTTGALLRNNTPPSLHDRIAQDLLETLEKQLKDYSIQAPRLLSKCESVVRHLVGVLHGLKVENISVCVSEHSEVVYSSLISLLDRMPSLKILKCSTNVASRKKCPLVRQIANSWQSLSSLTSFTLACNATDSLIAGLCKNCKAVREIVVPNSEYVSNCSIDYLIELKELQVVDLDYTSVDEEGYYDLLTKSESNSLFHFGVMRWSMRFLMISLEKDLRPFRTFSLQRLLLQASPSAKDFCLIVKYFPLLNEFALSSTAPMYDSSQISRLKNLTHLNFTCMENETIMNHLSRFFSARGPFITSLSLKYTVTLKSKNLIDIFVSCPNIEYFKLEKALFEEDPDCLNILHPAEPFQKLTEFIIRNSNVDLSYVKCVLSNAGNIQKVILQEIESAITDDFLESILKANPLKRLRSLEINSGSNSVSANMLKRIITHCDKITSLTHFASSTAVTKTELKRLRAFIVANNYDLVLI